MDWQFFTSDEHDDEKVMYLVPGFFRDELYPDLKDSFNRRQGPMSYNSSGTSFERSNELGFDSSNHSNRNPFPFSESAPPLTFMDDDSTQETRYQSILSSNETQLSDHNTKYLQVQFHPFRVEVYKYSINKELVVGDYVVTEADRGYDVGKILCYVQRPSIKELKGIKNICRLASKHEINQLPEKEEREQKAKEICQRKANELNLPMQITCAEYQFDGKKLTFYYTANFYVDFRSLVKSLFKVFGMRIWMVWHDGKAPIKDVHQKNENNKANIDK